MHSNPGKYLVKFRTEFRKRLSPMAYAAFFFPIQLGKGFLKRRIVKNRVIAKSVISGGCLSNETFTARFVGKGLTGGNRNGNYTFEKCRLVIFSGHRLE